MAKEFQRRIDPRAQRSVTGPSATTDIVARPVDTFVRPAEDPVLSGLINGLAAINPEIARLGVYQGLNNTEEGAAARAAGKPLDETKPDSFEDGYIMLDTRVAAANDGVELLTAYQTSFDRDTGNLDNFIAEFYKSKASGMSDPVAREVYDREFGAHAEKLRELHVEAQQQAIVDRHFSNAQERVVQIIGDHLADPDGPDLAGANGGLDQLRQQLAAVGISGSQFNELTFNALYHYGKQGKFEVFQLARMPREDGTPGLASIPAFARKVDQAEIEATNAYYTLQARADEASKRAREERVEGMVTPLVIQAIEGEADEAQRQLLQLAKDNPGLFKANDIFMWQGRLTQLDNREAKGEQLLNESRLIEGLYKGTVGVKQLTNALTQEEITPAQYRSLVGTLRSFDSMSRQEAATAKRNSIFNHHTYEQQAQYVRDVLRPQPAGPADVMGLGTLGEREVQASSVREFASRAAQVQDPAELPKIADEIVTQAKLRQKQLRDDSMSDNRVPGYILYPSLAEATAAVKRGTLSPESYRLHLEYYKANP